jgi:hypothetical protein
MELEYIKANGTYYRPQPSGVRDESKCFGNHHVCLIKKLFFGRWQIDYYDRFTAGSFTCGDEDKTTSRKIIYPSGIEEIKWNK